MPYIGKEPEHGNYQRIDTIASSFNGSTTVFNLRADSVSVYPTSPATMIIALGGVIQEPNTSWGALISEGAGTMRYGTLWQLLFPLFFFVVSLFSFFFYW